MFAQQLIPYNQTNSFTKIALDYLQLSEKLKPFYSFPPNIEGFKNAIEQNKRAVLQQQQIDALILELDHLKVTQKK